MTDFANELLQLFKDRIKSRFWPTYILVWCAFHWDFLYVLFCAPFVLTEETLTLVKLYLIRGSIWSFIGVPFLVSIGVSMIVPYIDVLIGLAQHQAFVWNKTQSTRLQLIVEQKNTELKKLLNIEVKEQTALEKETEEERKNSAKYNQQKAESLRIYNHLDKLVSENTLLTILDHHDSLSDLSEDISRKLKQYTRAAKTIEYTYPNKDIAGLHEHFIHQLSDTGELLKRTDLPTRLASIRPGDNSHSQQLKRTIEATISEYRNYRMALKELYSF